MTRFVKQRDQYSCGPIAVLNLMKHFGYKIPQRSIFYNTIKVLSGCDKNGCHIPSLNRLLKLFGGQIDISGNRLFIFSKKYKGRGKLNDIVEFFQEDPEEKRAIILIHLYHKIKGEEPQSHVSLITYADHNSFYCVNLLKEGPSLVRLNRKDMSYYLRKRKDLNMNFPILWFFRKDEKCTN